MIYPFKGNKPIIDESCFIAPSADIIGSVSVGKNSSIWYNCVLRGDYNSILIGSRSNIQDSSVIHIDSPKDISSGSSVFIGDDVTIGHNVIIHACSIANACLIGMGACILDGAVISEESIVGAGSLITKGKSFPPRSLILGSPAVRVRSLSPSEVENLYLSAERYVNFAKEHSFEMNRS